MSAFSVGFVFLAFLLLVGAVWLFVAAGADARNRRLRRRLGEADRDKGVTTQVQKAMSVPVFGRLYKLLWRSGIEVTPAGMFRGVIAAIIIAALLLVVLGLARGAVVLVILVIVGLFFLNYRANKRRMQLVEQLPAFLENVVRILTAGNTLDEAFVTAGRENPEPVRGMMLAVGRQARLGVPLEQALEDAGTVYRLRDLKVIALAVAVNRRYGGSIRNVFRSLVSLIRQRATAAKELKALTAETRFSAVVLAFISIGLFAYMYLRNPQYYAHMLATTSGLIILGISLGLLVAGSIILWRMTTMMGGAEE